MSPLPEFDLHYPDGLALVDLEERIDLDTLDQSQHHRHLFEKLTRAAADIERLKQGWRPTPELLADAPLLTEWSFGGSHNPGGTNLMGFVTGHPRIRDGGYCTTSVLIAIDAKDWVWARTVSRFYRIQLVG